VISVQSVGMLVFIPIMVAVADRFGTHRLVLVNVLLLGVPHGSLDGDKSSRSVVSKRTAYAKPRGCSLRSRVRLVSSLCCGPRRCAGRACSGVRLRCCGCAIDPGLLLLLSWKVVSHRAHDWAERI
jgi:hypothetical protein